MGRYLFIITLLSINFTTNAQWNFPKLSYTSFYGETEGIADFSSPLDGFELPIDLENFSFETDDIPLDFSQLFIPNNPLLESLAFNVIGYTNVQGFNLFNTEVVNRQVFDWSGQLQSTELTFRLGK